MSSMGIGTFSRRARGRLGRTWLARSLALAVLLAGAQVAAQPAPAKGDSAQPAAPAPAATPAAAPASAPAPAAGSPGAKPAPGAPAAGAPAAKPAPGRPGGPATPREAPVEAVDNNQSLGERINRPWAVGVTEQNQAEALRHFREGNALLNDGVFITAAKHYRLALQHWDHPAIHYNLALALMKQDQPIDLYQSLIKSLKYDPKDHKEPPLDEDKYDRAKNYLELAQKQVATVDIGCDMPGAKVAIDGEEVFVGPGRHQGLVRIGKHSFVAEKEGYVTRIEAPYIGPGETMRLSLKLYSAKELTRYRRKWQATWMPWAVVGFGGAVAAASGFVYASGRSDVSDFDARISACGAAGCPITPELTDMRDSGVNKQTWAWVGFGVGAGTIATGLVLAYVNRVRPYQIRPEDLSQGATGASASSRTTVQPLVGPGLAGAAATFSF